MSFESTIERWIAEFREDGLRQGWLEGLRDGIREGRREGEAGLVAAQLAERFGELPPNVAAQIESANSETLRSWACRLVHAHQLCDVFGD